MTSLSSDPAASTTVDPFTIDVPGPVLDDLRRRLAGTRFPDPVGEPWTDGMPPAYLRDLVAYWEHAYQWAEHQRRLNRLDHYTTAIDGQSIHFVHARAADDDAFPVLLVHGWPGSFIEFLDVIPRLTRPGAHGRPADHAFHVVVPSLPGYGFSEAPRAPGWDVQRIAEAFAVLMARLGYDRYGAQGGDWGAQVATRLALHDPDHCVGLHLNMAVAPRPDGPVDLTDEDRADLAAMAAFQREEGAYAAEQGTKPQTIGAALDDSPAGLLAWIVEKFRTWSDGDGDPEHCFTRDQLLTNVMLYWVTRTGASAARLYWECNRSGVLTRAVPFVEVPTGVARFPKEPLRWPRAWVERQYNVTSWTELPHGGHFAAMEQPELFSDDVTAFFRTIR